MNKERDSRNLDVRVRKKELAQSPVLDTEKEILLAFAGRARGILEGKGVPVIGTRVRNWQAAEDPGWRECVLDLTVAARADDALNVWDELSEELQRFVNDQPENIRNSLTDKLSLNVEWV